MNPDQFRRIKVLFGRMDDLCQERRRTYTAWVSDQIEPAAFVAAMRENLSLTKEATEALEELLK
jgi:hypothetical protein